MKMTSLKKTGLLAASLFFNSLIWAQQDVKLVKNDKDQKVDVFIGGKLFTSYLYTNDIDKPVLYPIATASGEAITRGFPLQPRANERTDHPHHIGMWFNYGDVNGLDFWNNSYAIKAEDKPKYGSIKHQQIIKTESGNNKGTLAVAANWVDSKGTILLKEKTTFTFSGTNNTRVIDRTTTLTAQDQKVVFKDNKEGVLGLRVSRELEMPADKPEIFTDAQGIPTKVAVLNNEGVNGNYLTSAGKTGNDAWGTRGNWCMLHGTKGNEPVAVTILDHPSNPGYPTYWHARGYGLFAANTLGQEALSGGKEKLNLTLNPNKSVTFRYRIIITNGNTPTVTEVNSSAKEFAGK